MTHILGINQVPCAWHFFFSPIYLEGFVHKLNSLLLLDRVSLTKGPALTLAARNAALTRQKGEKLLQQRGQNTLSLADNQGIGCKALFKK